MESNIHTRLNTEKTEAGIFRKHAGGFADAALVICLMVLVAVYKVPAPVYELMTSMNGTLFLLIFYVIYRFMSLLIFNATPGMLLSKVCLLDADQQPLSILEKILASVFILYKGTGYYNR